MHFCILHPMHLYKVDLLLPGQRVQHKSTILTPCPSFSDSASGMPTRECSTRCRPCHSFAAGHKHATHLGLESQVPMRCTSLSKSVQSACLTLSMLHGQLHHMGQLAVATCVCSICQQGGLASQEGIVACSRPMSLFADISTVLYSNFAQRVDQGCVLNDELCVCCSATLL